MGKDERRHGRSSGSSRERSRRRSPERPRRGRGRSPSLEAEQRAKKRRFEKGEEKERKDDEAEKERRRRRMEAWQKQQKKMQEMKEKEMKKATEEKEEENSKEKEDWNLEDEAGLSDDDGQQLKIELDGKSMPSIAGGDLKEHVGEKESDVFEALIEMSSMEGGNGEEKLGGRPGGGGQLPNTVQDGQQQEEEDVDPLDAYMQHVEMAIESLEKHDENTTIVVRNGGEKNHRQGYESESSSYGSVGDEAEEEEIDDEEWARRVRAGKLSKGDKMGVIDHSKIAYPPFRRNFYIEVPELARMSEEEVKEYRVKLDGIKVRGKDIPKPIKSWYQAGLSSRIIEALRKSSFDSPLPIQAQALPVIMSGRDCIGVAKTGSGKTLGFVLPMLRHVKDQPPLKQGDGPIGMVMAPTRELVTQIGKEVKRFAKAVGISCTCVYGGSGIANQISELKRGSEIVVCTPGRMIDILASGPGKITNLQRVTFLVMDEADRMFDMGFEPQIMRIVNNIRPDRQTVLFSATFPRTVELLARKVLTNPVEIQLGGRSVVNSDITQIIEIRPEEERFLRLLQLLGEWYEKGKLLVFVSSQDRCDTLFRDLLRAGYPCLSLHGGKDQSDRESTIVDFKSGVCNVLVATSVAARGLDVKDLVLVVNYDCPNHHEEYVHRVGRTGRAGRKGTAVTFISPEEEQYAPDLVKALTESGATIPNDLLSMAQKFQTKKKAGLAKAHASGFGGSGFKFDIAEDAKVKSLRKSTAKGYGIVDTSESEDEDIHAVQPSSLVPPPSTDQHGTKLDSTAQAQIKAAQALADKLSSTRQPPQPSNQPKAIPIGPSQPSSVQPSSSQADIAAAAQAALQALGVASSSATQTLTPQEQPKLHFQTELEINDFPQQARWKATHRETLRTIGEQFSAAVVVRGRYCKPGVPIPEGEKKLHLQIQGATPDIVKKAKAEIKRILEESTEKAMRREAPTLM